MPADVPSRDRPYLDTGELPDRIDAVVVGGGPAGLASARELARRGIDALVLEASDDVGGRVRSRVVGGYTLERGFQVFNTAYPEARRQLDYDALDLRTFDSGAAVRTREGGFQAMLDPTRHPARALRTLGAPIGTVADKARLGLFALQTRATSPQPTDRAAITSAQRIAQARIGALGSDVLAPFFAGVFLEEGMATAGRKLEWLMGVFGSGSAALPAAGMSAIPRQLATGSAGAEPPLRVRVGAPVLALDPNQEGGWRVQLEDGRTLRARACVVATEELAARELLEGFERRWTTPASAPACVSTTLYYGMEEPPHRTPLMCLNGTGHGRLNNVAVVSNVAPEHAPQARSLVQATVVGETDLEGDALQVEVRRELTEWFGAPVGQWQHLDTVRVGDALPFFRPDEYGVEQPRRIADRLFVCGDHVDGATLDGALRSGRLAGADAAHALA